MKLISKRKNLDGIDMSKTCPECKSGKTKLVARVNERGAPSMPAFGGSYRITCDELYQCKECKNMWLVENE